MRQHDQHITMFRTHGCGVLSLAVSCQVVVSLICDTVDVVPGDKSRKSA